MLHSAFRHFQNKTLAIRWIFFSFSTILVKMLKDVRNFFNGAVYGMVLTIPGISATLFAIILKFYEELIHTINHFRENTKKNLRYLGVFILGIIAGAVIFSSFLLFLLENFSFVTMLFFSGLLAGMIPFIAMKAKGENPNIGLQKTAVRIALLAISFFVLLWLSNAAETPAYAGATMNLVLIMYVFLAGLINGATLVIPGLSGAFILLIMGLFPLVISSISAVGTFLGDVGNPALLGEIAAVLAPFGIGGILGCIAMARIMERLLAKHSEEVYSVILGLLLASVTALLQENLAFIGSEKTGYLIIGGAIFLAGAASAYILGKRQ